VGTLLGPLGPGYSLLQIGSFSKRLICPTKMKDSLPLWFALNVRQVESRNEGLSPIARRVQHRTGKLERAR
jgi:hypothetical protein